MNSNLDAYVTQTIEQAAKLLNDRINKPIYTLEETEQIGKLVNNIATLPVDFYAIGIALSRIAIKRITGKFNEIIQNTIKKWLSNTDFEKLRFVIQEEPLGTGHAVKCVNPHLLEHNPNEKVVILSGDVPLLKVNTIRSLITDKQVTLLSTKYSDPTGYGRIIQDDSFNFIKITIN